MKDAPTTYRGRQKNRRRRAAAALMFVLVGCSAGVAAWKWSGADPMSLTFDEALAVVADKTSDEAAIQSAAVVLRRHCSRAIAAMEDRARDPAYADFMRAAIAQIRKEGR